ncbi:replication protein A 32 kDa subunit B [Trifolium pratense]|uniref:replication protein A 32 kDa subunit B n=1 Tax=Trifolium pratense TaxID=57577 RepID=UPI001E696BA4|nr:replication protein A 32 kDa subunit B [Trifolium pratense]
MNTSQFDGNAAFAGGGFMPSQTTQGANSPFTPSKIRDSQTLLPLTIKQANDAFQSSDGSNLTIDGVDVNTVTFVGRVCNKVDQITDSKFVLDDGTGTIECIKWIDDPVDSNEVDGILNGMYVRLYGQFKGLQGKKCINVYSLRPVTDFDEIANHFINCIYVHLYNSRLQRIQASIPNQQHVPSLTQITPTKGYQAQAVAANQFSGQHNNGQKTVEDMVLDVLHLPANRTRTEGCPLESIAQHLGLPSDKIMLAIHNLTQEGMIYEGLTNHYKSTVNG